MRLHLTLRYIFLRMMLFAYAQFETLFSRASLLMYNCTAAIIKKLLSRYAQLGDLLTDFHFITVSLIHCVSIGKVNDLGR